MTPEEEFEELYAGFEREVIRPDASSEQRASMRMAFVSGALTACTYYLSLRQHVPTNIHHCMTQWAELCHGEAREVMEALRGNTG